VKAHATRATTITALLLAATAVFADGCARERGAGRVATPANRETPATGPAATVAVADPGSPAEPIVPTDPGVPVAPAVADAIPRRRVRLEILQMTGTPALETRQTIRGVEVSLENLFAPAGIDLEIVVGRTDLPRLEDVTLAQLHGLLMETRTPVTDANAAELHIEALVVTRDHAEEDALGVMFDFGEQDENDVPREAFAIYADSHRGLVGTLQEELLLTAAHELAHCFNLHHSDWEGSLFERDATIEGYSLTDTVRWRLSDRSLQHLRNHDRREVDPGRTSLPFGWVGPDHLAGHQPSPVEDFRLMDGGSVLRVRRDGTIDGGERAGGEGGPTAAPLRAPRLASLRRRGGAATPNGSSPLRLALRLPKQRFLVGERVDVTVELWNGGTQPAVVNPHLDPAYGFLAIAARRGGGEWQPFEPIARRDARGRPVATLAPGEALTADAPVFFGASGWTFEEPGDYEVVADYDADAAPGGRVASPTLRFSVAAANSAPTLRAKALLSNAAGRLGREQGLYLYFQGGDHLRRGAEAIRSLATVSEAPQAASAKLALARAALEPSTAAGRGRGPAERAAEARRYLDSVSSQMTSSVAGAAAAVDPDAVSHVAAALSAELRKAGQSVDAERYRVLALEAEAKKAVRSLSRRQLERLRELERRRVRSDSQR
jgi:hypothetical protein